MPVFYRRDRDLNSERKEIYPDLSLNSHLAFQQWQAAADEAFGIMTVAAHAHEEAGMHAPRDPLFIMEFVK